MNHNLNTITESIVGCAYTLANTPGHGFIEKMMDCITETIVNNQLLAPPLFKECRTP